MGFEEREEESHLFSQPSWFRVDHPLSGQTQRDRTPALDPLKSNCERHLACSEDWQPDLHSFSILICKTQVFPYFLIFCASSLQQRKKWQREKGLLSVFIFTLNSPSTVRSEYEFYSEDCVLPYNADPNLGFPLIRDSLKFYIIKVRCNIAYCYKIGWQTSLLNKLDTMSTWGMKALDKSHYSLRLNNWRWW